MTSKMNGRGQSVGVRCCFVSLLKVSGEDIKEDANLCGQGGGGM